MAEGTREDPNEGQAYFIVSNPSLSLAKICAVIENEQRNYSPQGIHSTAIVDPTATIDRTATVGPFAVIESHVTIGQYSTIGAHCFIGHGSSIGTHTCLKPRVTLYPYCQIGENVIIHSGAVIGSDGFGYETDGGVHHKLPHIGRVIIDDQVEIGANTTIDRARFAATYVGKGTKIDNLVQLGHNVRLGENCIIVAQVGIAGSTVLGKGVILGGQVGIAGHISIGERAQIAAQGGVSGNVEPGSVLRGTPAMKIDEANRFYVLRKRIPELFRRVAALEEKIKMETSPN
jgi:UDP-3-O-[3-hydroxymyristoyl] glucosamine N-acyltransferase